MNNRSGDLQNNNEEKVFQIVDACGLVSIDSDLYLTAVSAVTSQMGILPGKLEKVLNILLVKSNKNGELCLDYVTKCQC